MFPMKMLIILFWACLLYIKATYEYPVAKHVRPSDLIKDMISHAGLCGFPFRDPSVAPVTSSNSYGWLPKSGKTQCKVGSYCSFFCSSGHTVNPKFSVTNGFHLQDPKEGRILCQTSGFSDSDPLCLPQSSDIYLLNNFDEDVSFCQSVASDGESLLASNIIDPNSYVSLSVSSLSFGSQPSLFYLNPPGTPSNVGCQNRSPLNSRGYWSPYFLETTKDFSGNTHMRLGWNPHYSKDVYWSNIRPNWGVIVESNGNGLSPASRCSIDPEKHNVNECENGLQDSKGYTYCSLSFPPNTKVTVSLFSRDNIDKRDSLVHKILYGISDSSAPSDPHIHTETDMTDTMTQDEAPNLQEESLQQGDSSQEGMEAGLESLLSEAGKQYIKDGQDSNNDLSTSDLSDTATLSSISKSGDHDHISVLYVEIPGGLNDLKIFDSKVSYSMSDLGSENLDSSLSQEKEVRHEEAQSYMDKMNAVCRYVKDRFGAYSTKLCTYFRHSNELTSSQNDDPHAYGMSPVGDVIQENNAFKTVKFNIQVSFVIILGITLLQFFM